MPILSITLLAAVLSAQTVAPHAPKPDNWPLTPVHQASTALERIPPAERSIAISLLKPYLGPLFQGESSTELNRVMRSFHAERLTLSGIPALAVQPAGNELCGATGNCSFWIVDLRHRRIILNADGIRSFTVSSSKAGGMPEIITASHASAFEQELIRWQFQGSDYHRADCATATSASDNGQTYSTPKITPHPCDPEGN